VGLQGDKIEVKSHVMVPVSTIHSKADHLPEVMDDLMQKAMKATDFGRVEFILNSLTFKGTHDAGKPFDLDASGDLVIAGKTNKVSFPVTMDPMDEGKLHVTGSVSIKMTDYGVEPPAPNFGLGMMKCGDSVKITFDWTLKEKK
jgi:polyisoprenoid-binding protein YceI